MEVYGFDWDEGNREKCKSHAISLEEIESVFNNQPNVMPDVKHITEEDRLFAVGVTKQGRHAFVVFTFRNGEDGILIRPISARYMHKKEIDHYEKQRKT